MHFRMPTKEDLPTAFAHGEAAVMALCHAVAPQRAELAPQLATQGAVLQAGQARRTTTSRNRSQPPSSDGEGQVTRTASGRKAGDQPQGGQPGHDGQPLRASEPPDRPLTHAGPSGAQCQASFQGGEGGVRKRAQGSIGRRCGAP